MATTAQIEAAIVKAEAAGDAPAVKALRDRLSQMQGPSPEAIQAAADKAKAAGDTAAYDALIARIPAPAATVAPAVAADQPAPPPRAQSENELGHKRATDFAGFEMFNPELKGRYTPETMPKAGDTVMGQGGGGKSGGARMVVRDWRRKPQEQFGDTAKAMMAGPMDAMASFGGGLTGGPSPSRDYLANDPLTKGLPSPVLTGLGAVGDAGGAALSAIGAGLSGAVGLATEAVPGQTADSREKLGSELLGMSQFAVPELAGGSSIVGRVASVAPKVLPKAVEISRKMAIAKPSVEALRAAKTTAYKAVDDAGETFSAEQMAGLRDQVTADLDAGNYVSGIDKQTDAVLSLLDRKSGEPMTLGQLDKLRQEFYKRLAAAPNEVGIEDAIDGIDAMIASNPASGELMQAARTANSKYKKIETLDLAFQKARDQTNSTGSGGNILNKYRQAVTSIVNNPKKAKWYSKDELATMRDFIEGTKSENALRLFGKLSPNGNGLMMALNLGAAGGTGGASLLVTGAAAGAKALADSSALRGTTRLMSKVAGEAAIPSKAAAKALRKPVDGDIIVGPLRDVASPTAQAATSEAANSNANPDYQALHDRYGR